MDIQKKLESFVQSKKTKIPKKTKTKNPKPIPKKELKKDSKPNPKKEPKTRKETKPKKLRSILKKPKIEVIIEKVEKMTISENNDAIKVLTKEMDEKMNLNSTVDTNSTADTNGCFCKTKGFPKCYYCLSKMSIKEYQEYSRKTPGYPPRTPEQINENINSMWSSSMATDSTDSTKEPRKRQSKGLYKNVTFPSVGEMLDPNNIERIQAELAKHRNEFWKNRKPAWLITHDRTKEIKNFF